MVLPGTEEILLMMEGVCRGAVISQLRCSVDSLLFDCSLTKEGAW